MKLPLPRRRSTWIAAGLVTPCVVVLVLISGVFVWSPLNCWHADIDINSGRVRRSWYLLYVQVRREIEPTWVSRAAAQPLGPAEWHRVTTFSPGTDHSPHYAYHSALAQVVSLEQQDALVMFTPQARRQVAREALRRWQAGSADEAEAYVHDVAETVMTLAGRGASGVNVSDLP